MWPPARPAPIIASPLALVPGSRLGPYEVLAAIGAGGMGAVYRATDTSLGRQVAIKVLPDAFAQDPERLTRFEREAKTLAALNHPHIAAIYGFERSSGTHALVMELVDGEDLSQRIARGRSRSMRPWSIAKQIAEALEAAHEQGIIHRDLKPANIKVRADGTVKVLDFGLAKAFDPPQGSGLRAEGELSNSPTLTSPAMTAMGMILGTAAYMAPEQAKGRAVDKRADIWAFGVVLYEMLTGRRAFDGEDVSELLVAVLSKDVDLNALPAGAPPRLRALVRDCLIRDPKQRLRDIGDARLVLDKIIARRTRRCGGSDRGDGGHRPIIVARAAVGGRGRAGRGARHRSVGAVARRVGADQRRRIATDAAVVRAGRANRRRVVAGWEGRGVLGRGRRTRTRIRCTCVISIPQWPRKSPTFLAWLV